MTANRTIPLNYAVCKATRRSDGDRGSGKRQRHLGVIPRLLVSQRINWVQTGCLKGGVVAEEDAN